MTLRGAAERRLTCRAKPLICKRSSSCESSWDWSIGEGTDGAQTWIDQGCQALLTGGWSAIRQHLSETKQTTSKRSHRESLKKLSGYLYRNRDRIGYAERLAEGRAIGSGQAEGACKHMIGRRLKQTGARWRVRRVNRMAVLCCLLYSDHWDAYWARN